MVIQDSTGYEFYHSLFFKLRCHNVVKLNRYQIYVLKKAGHNQTVIASLLGRDKSTISRELRRNRGLKGYRPQQANKLALGRRHDKAQPRISESVWQHVEALLREQWSPEQSPAG